MRSRLRSSISGSSDSWNGSAPPCSDVTRSATTSRTMTSWPSSAKQPPVTRPTQPAPKMPMVRESAMTKRSLAAERMESACDCEHRLVRERVEDRVDHPVRRAAFLQDDHVQVRAGVVQVVHTAVDSVLEARRGKDRRIVPIRFLDPPEVGRRFLEREADTDVALHER